MQDEPKARGFLLQWRSAVLNSAMTATQKLSLLTLAEWADPDGTNCWPALETIADKASLAGKSASRAMKAAEQQGWIRRQHRGTKQGWRLFSYTLLIPKGADTESLRSDQRGDTESAPHDPTCGLSVPNVRTLSPERGDTESDDLANDLANTKPKKKAPSRKGSKRPTFREWEQGMPEGADLIPDSHSVFKYAGDVGIPSEYLVLAWNVFREKYQDDTKTRLENWPDRFKRAVVEQWLSLWWIDSEGHYLLTTKGKQADLYHKTGIQAQSTNPHLEGAI